MNAMHNPVGRLSADPAAQAWARLKNIAA